MKQFRVMRFLGVAAVLAAALMATQSVRAQSNIIQYPLLEGGPISDVVIYGPASNPFGLSGTNIATEAIPASELMASFLQTAANVPNGIGIELMEPGTTNFVSDPSVVSDQLWTQAGYWYYASDPYFFTNFTVVAMLPETGYPQDVSSYFGLPPNSMQVASDVPEPTTFVLAGLGAAALLVLRRRK